MVKNLPVNAGDARDAGSIPGLGRSAGEGNGTAPQYSCLKNSMSRGAWWATVQGATKSWTRLSTHRMETGKFGTCIPVKTVVITTANSSSPQKIVFSSLAACQLWGAGCDAFLTVLNYLQRSPLCWLSFSLTDPVPSGCCGNKGLQRTCSLP